MRETARVLAAGLLLVCIGSTGAQANVIIAGTRVIFPANDGEVTLRLTNESKRPALIEAWIDSGDAHSTPDKVDTPFLITPPVFRMEAHKDQSLRILFTHAKQPLPTDRESVFWLNVLEIPPRPSGKEFQDKNYLQLAIRSRLKLFYRPANLAVDPLKAPSEVTWRAVADAGGYALELQNPTPYHVTVVKLSLTSGGKSYSADTGMVDPRGTLRLPVKGLSRMPAADTSIAYDIVNDYGAVTALKGSLTP